MDYNLFARRLQDLHRSAAVDGAENDAEMSVPAAQEPPPTPSTSSSTQDVDMDSRNDNGNDDMPALQNISDTGSDSDRDADEVDMYAYEEDPPLPEVELTPGTSRSNRRARVDDDDDDRDRRHPSERLNTPLAGQSSSNSRSVSRAGDRPINELPSPFSISLHPPATPTPSTPNRAAGTSDNPPGDARPQDLPPFLTDGIGISIDIQNGQPTVDVGGPQPQQGNSPGGFALPEGPTLEELLSNHTFLGDLLGIKTDVEDPERAERLINGLEEVPEGLVKRLERVGGMAGANGTELNGGDSGCAVCWEKLLEADAEVSKEESSDEKEKPRNKIVSLPCAHVFHAECLRPWFSRPRQTTCPTCRFNIDPENLTHDPYRQRRRAQEQAQAQAAASAATQTDPASAATGETPAAPAPTAGLASEVPEPGPVASRGRMGPPPINPASPTTRRPSSEPPANRRPQPAAAALDLVQSFAVPGGHILIVNHPLGPISDAQGRPTGGELYLQRQYIITGARGADRRGTDTAQQLESNGTGPSSSSDIPQPDPSTTPPIHGPPPPPTISGIHGIRRTSMPGGGALPPGVIAFDFHLPFPLPFTLGGAQATPEQSDANPPPAVTDQAAPRPRPEIHVPPAGFAGLNFGNRQAQQPPTFGELLQRFFQQGSQAAEPQSPSGNTNASDNNTNPDGPRPAPPTAATSPPAETNNDSSARQSSPSSDDRNQEARQEADIDNVMRNFATAIRSPAFLFRFLMSAVASGAIPFGTVPGMFRGTGSPPNVPKKEWVVPPAPGPTLRQRVEKREREAGLRCYDVSCGVGPSDDDPLVALTEAVKRQFSIHPKDDEKGHVCPHTFHSSCLVVSERIASRGADTSVVDDHIQVSCPVCRSVGCVFKRDWDEGVHNLE